jgi:predicted DNA-binding transcriptional regulator AlpA
MTKRSTDETSPLKHFDDLPDDALVRQPVVEALFACKSTSVWRGVKAGRIPTPKKPFPNVTAWRVGDLRAALAALA